MTIYKVLKYLAIVIGVVSAFLLGRVLVAGDDSIMASADVQASVVDPFLIVSYIVLALVIVLVLIFVIKGLFTGDIKKTLMSVGVFLLVVLVSYLLANGEVMYDRNDVQTISASGSKWVGTGLITFYILAIVAIGAMVLSGVKKLMK